jgi:hypothetical protein
LQSLRHLLEQVKDGNLSSLRDLVSSLPDSGLSPAK